MTVKTLVIVPARSGSKGIADKNIKLLGGKPLLEWTANTIQAAALAESLAILSTDSEQYAEVGRAAGLQVPFIRPTALANDHASGLAVIEHALHWFKQQYTYLPEQILLLQPTSPFRSAGVLQQALDILKKEQADGVVSCKAIYRDLTTLFSVEAGFLKPLSTETTQTRRQDKAPLLTPNGSLYLCKTSVILAKHSLYGERTVPLLMEDKMNLDIDTLADWAMAEAIIQAECV